jgi:hypothetical protein
MINIVNVKTTVFKEDNIKSLEKKLNITFPESGIYISEFSDRLKNASTDQILNIIFPELDKAGIYNLRKEFELDNNSSRRRTILESNILLLMNVTKQEQADAIVIDPFRFLKDNEILKMRELISKLSAKKNIYILANKQEELNDEKDEKANSETPKLNFTKKIKQSINYKLVTLKRNWIKLLFIIVLGAIGGATLSTATVLEGHDKPIEPSQAVKDKIQNTLTPEVIGQIIQQQIVKDFNNTSITPIIDGNNFNVKIVPGQDNKIVNPGAVEDPKMLGTNLLNYLVDYIQTGFLEETKDNLRDNLVYTVGNFASSTLKIASFGVMLPFYFLSIFGLFGYLRKQRKHLSNILTHKQYRSSVLMTGMIYIGFVIVAMLLGTVIFNVSIQNNLGIFKGRFDFHRFFVNTNFYVVILVQIIITLFFLRRKENKESIVRNNI